MMTNSVLIDTRPPRLAPAVLDASLFPAKSDLIRGRTTDISGAIVGIVAHAIVGTVSGIGALVDRRTVG